MAILHCEPRDRIAVEAGADPAVKDLQPYTLEIAGEQDIALTTRAIVRDMILDGVIGMPVLVRWSLTMDLANDALWITPTR